MLAPILVTKLNRASEPTASMGGTPKPKMRMGSSRTPPPTPVIPMRAPTPKPTRLLISRSMTVTTSASPHFPATCDYRCGLRGLRSGSDNGFPFEVQDDLLCCLFGGQVFGIHGDFCIRRNFVRI